MNKLKICWITLCYNEMDILPFVRQYWERIADKVVVYDNGSTDGSIEYLSKLPYVELKHFNSDGQNDPIQKMVKEQAYLEYKDKYDVIIISDMDELFYFNSITPFEQMIKENYSCLVTCIYSLCEDYKPQYDEDKLLHQLCHKFYLQKMNHMKGFEKVSKISIFNTKLVDSINMSVGQHYVYTNPKDKMQVLHSLGGFCIHIDKGLGEDYYVNRRRIMANNLSDVNKRTGMCIEYMKSEEESRKEYKMHQYYSFDINELMKKG